MTNILIFLKISSLCYVNIFQDEILVNNKSAGIVISGSSSSNSLILPKVSRERAGNYSCIGINTFGTGYSNKVSLTVLCKYIYQNQTFILF